MENFRKEGQKKMEQKLNQHYRGLATFLHQLASESSARLSPESHSYAEKAVRYDASASSTFVQAEQSSAQENFRRPNTQLLQPSTQQSEATTKISVNSDLVVLLMPKIATAISS